MSSAEPAMALPPTQRALICDLLDLTDPDQKRIIFQTALHFDRSTVSTSDADEILKFLSTSDKLMLRLALAYIGAKEALNDDEASQFAVQLTGMWTDLVSIVNSPNTQDMKSTYTFINLEHIRKMVARLEFKKTHLSHTSGKHSHNRAKRVKTDDCVPVANSFAVLQETETAKKADDSENQPATMSSDSADKTDTQTVAMETTVITNSTVPAPKPPRVEPIFVNITGNWINFVKTINTTVLKTPVNVKLSGEYIKVPPATIDDYRLLTNFLIEKGIPFHALQPKPERPIKILLKGLKHTTPIEDIAAELIDFGVEPIHISYLKKKTGEPMPLFLVTLQHNAGWEKIYDLTHIHCMEVTVKAFRSHGVKQCYRCQGFGHASQTCHMPPKCLKCAAGHHTRECVKPKSIPAACCNCGGPHPANFSGCPSNPKNAKPKNPKHPKNPKLPENIRKFPVDAPLPATPAWTSPNPAILSPYSATKSDFPSLPNVAVPVTEAPGQADANPSTERPGRNAAAKRAAAAAASRRQTESTREQHQAILNDYAMPTTGGGIGEVLSLIKNILDVVNLPNLISILKDVFRKVSSTDNQIDQAFILLQALANLSQSSQNKH